MTFSALFPKPEKDEAFSIIPRRIIREEAVSPTIFRATLRAMFPAEVRAITRTFPQIRETAVVAADLERFDKNLFEA
jgi:hypothetical protein